MKGAVVSTWNEDFADAMRSVGMPPPGDFDALETYDFISQIDEGIKLAGEGATVAEVLGYVTIAGVAVVLAEAAGVALTMTAATYMAALLAAALYASAKQGWEFLSAPIDLQKLLEWAKEYEAPVLELPVTEEVSWYPEASTQAVEPPPPPPPYPGDVVKRDSTDTDSVERIQQALEILGYDVSIDGDFGPRTEHAVKAFQKAQGLEVDGKVGSDTWKALFGG
jgi:murein L,D-transpeptidase YcbB/YkuD